MIDFDRKTLIKKYGSWVRVQVAFYDFLFDAASELCAAHFRETALEEFATGGFADGNNIYEATISKLEELFEMPEKAWSAFLEAEYEAVTS